jgi:periplasmic protein TonB
MVVRAKASVRADGTPIAVRILDDPGYGFGSAARLCGLRHTYVPARDAEGGAVEGETLPFSVYFDR